MSEPTRYLAWMRQGTDYLSTAVERLDDGELAGPSRLPGWTRAHVVAHLARNADALINLLTWARTGVETPMYPSVESRDADIETSAAAPPSELRADFTASLDRLEHAIATMTDATWDGQVRTRQGRAIPASEVPWMRCREVWVHAVDLDAGCEFAQFPAELAVALLTDACAFAASKPADVRIVATDDPAPDGPRFETTLGAGSSTVRAPLAELLPWVLGRETRPDWPALPAWL